MSDKTTPDKHQFIENLIRQMSLEQKVGQCFTFLWSGHLITPSVTQAIEKLHVGGLRITPYTLFGKRSTYYNYRAASDTSYDYPPGIEPIAENLFSGGFLAAPTPEEYAAQINQLQALAVQRPGGIPLHIATDQEGDGSRDYPYGRINIFPSQMGLRASGDPEFVYECWKASARQQSAMGITTIHSPVLDVNTNPRNPEIGVRSFGDDPGVVAEYGLAALRGIQDGGLIATGKHFPGRGDSDLDAHYETPVIDADRQRLFDVDLLPYRHLIAHGLPSIMVAHTIYPALDPSGKIATMSPVILQDILRGELGFEGVITTDSISMQAIMNHYTLPEACATALHAGADLVLLKLETEYRDQGYWETVKWVREGRISESELNAKVRRILMMKVARGLFDTRGQVNAGAASAPIHESCTISLAQEAARRAISVLRDQQELLPVAGDQRVLVVEQSISARNLGHNTALHRLALNEAMLEHSDHVIGIDTAFNATKRADLGDDSDEAAVMDLLDRADVVVATNFYGRDTASNADLIRQIIQAGKKLILITNTPYEFGALTEAGTVICTFATTPQSMRSAAGIIFGTEQAQGQWPLVHYHPQAQTTPER